MGRPRFVAAALVAASFGATVTWVTLAAADTCDVSGGQNCAGAVVYEKEPLAPSPRVGEAVSDAVAGASPDATEEGEAGDGLAEDVRGPRRKQRMEREQIGYLGLGLVLGLALFVLLWICATIKFACDGSLPARLALWGLLPEAYAAISVPSVVALLRLKTRPTPVIVLQNCVTDVGAKELAEGLRLYGQQAELEALELPHNPRLTEEGTRLLVEVASRESSTLQELDFSFNPQLGGGVVEALRPLLSAKTSKISTLRLADCGLQIKDVEALASSVEKSGLRTLDLSGNSLTGGGAAVAAVLEAPILEEIKLTCCDLDPSDIQEIGEQLPYTSLKSLQLGGNRFGSEGLAELVEVLPRCSLDELGLEGNDIKSADLASLGAAWVKRPFARVRLNGNQISNEELSTFVGTLRSMRA